MGEYIKYNGEEVKIGTCENLYYTSYQMYDKALKSGGIQPLSTESPESYAKADSGFRFRFPFPDEDGYTICDERMVYDRGIAITVDQGIITDGDLGVKTGQKSIFEITQQKLIHRQSDGKLCLALVLRDPVKSGSFRVEEDVDIRAILKQIIKHHISNESNLGTKVFFRKICFRLLKGYRMDKPNQAVKNQTKKIGPAKRRKGKGL